ncbi:MAG: hypothetical protein IJD92_03240 [Bacilli bacterium]|nr:hypothetical protein [Bacilli bacterium]
MSKFTKEMINDYADKLLIGLTDEENQTVLDEFEAIEARMDLINEIDGLSSVEPMHYPYIIESNPRSGDVIKNDSVEDLLKNSDKVSDREIEVPKVVG